MGIEPNGKLANAIMFAIYKQNFMAYLPKYKRSHPNYTIFKYHR
ncbi:hypothetical protein AB0756_11400 [Tolypothrix campylonemoides VB511288_2]|uniref:Transposase n=1 Tax=Tolypothrix campylonemoides VB511288_2 TaxID=3232311 RepID=A0ABW8X7D1_9CYAN|nr:hypothetical protein [Tolypothrix bouteillei]